MGHRPSDYSYIFFLFYFTAPSRVDLNIAAHSLSKNLSKPRVRFSEMN